MQQWERIQPRVGIINMLTSAAGISREDVGIKHYGCQHAFEAMLNGLYPAARGHNDMVGMFVDYTVMGRKGFETIGWYNTFTGHGWSAQLLQPA